MKKILKIFKALLFTGIAAYIGLFIVFFFDLDGKALFHVVSPFLIKHYDNMPRKDMTKTEYGMDSFPKYEYEREEDK